MASSDGIPFSSRFAHRLLAPRSLLYEHLDLSYPAFDVLDLQSVIWQFAQLVPDEVFFLLHREAVRTLRTRRYMSDEVLQGQ